MINKQFYSYRGFLLFTPPDAELPLLTVELYCKWYKFYLITKDENVIPINWDIADSVYEKGGCISCVDHAPHPQFYVDSATVLKVNYSELVKELIAGRFVEEVYYMQDILYRNIDTLEDNF